MRFTSVLAGLVLVLAFGVAMKPSRSDTPPALPETSTSNTDEPITGTATMPNPGDAVPIKDPFSPYGTGPVAELVQYSDLTAPEQAWIDRNRDTTGWSAIHNGYEQAAIALAANAQAEAAQIQLGTGNLNMGVVP
jgi:hypothetical protein